VHGQVSPAVFIPIAETSGLIGQLGEWVLERACEQGVAWQRAGLPLVRISVNLSPVQLQSPDLASTIRNVLARTALPPEMLELEVTEGALICDPDEAAVLLDALRSAGIRIAIDDFGTGHSSLAYLRRFRIDRLKIDRSFICDVGAAGRDEAIAVAVIGLADALGFEVIAEGVENAAQRDFLLGHGCTDAQGFLYSPAVAPEAVAAMLQASHCATAAGTALA
jgi:EAL domain-containing protein (putative c-di-GMP-specific phosphodiesterase class I)